MSFGGVNTTVAFEESNNENWQATMPTKVSEVLLQTYENLNVKKKSIRKDNLPQARIDPATWEERIDGLQLS